MQFTNTHPSELLAASSPRALLLGLVTAILLGAGCRKNIADEASDSDANGYLCTQCAAKFYTKRSVFLGATCPTCGKDGLVEVVGYYCEHDRHLTLTGRTGDRGNGPICEKCRASLSGMKLPREKDLQAWGAKKI